MVLGLAVYGVIVLSGGEEQSKPGKSVQKNNEKEDVWDGKAEHIYKMEIPDDTGALFIDRASFTGLRSSRATAILRMSYEGSALPKWLQGNGYQKNFSAFYQDSDDRVPFEVSRGPLQDDVAVIDFVMRRVPPVRLDSFSRKGLFVTIKGILPREETFYLRVSVNPEPGYMLGSG